MRWPFFWGLSMAFVANAAQADLEPSDTPLRFDRTLTIRSELWSSSRQLDDVQQVGQVAFWIKGKVVHDQWGQIRYDAWARDQARPSSTPANDTPSGVVRELYWRQAGELLDFSVGRQIFNWGRADGINPTDNLATRNFTHLTPEDSDQKLGVASMRFAMALPVGNVALYWVPCANSHTVPVNLPAGVQLETINNRNDCAQRAIKWDVSHNGIDASLSYLEGMDLMPDLSVKSAGAGGVSLALQNNPSRVLGADTSFSAWGLVWRGEFAWKEVSRPVGEEFSRKNSQRWLIFGPEKQFSNGWTVGVQASYLEVLNYQSPDTLSNPLLRDIAWKQQALNNQTQPYQSGAIWRIAKRWRNDTLLTEVSGAQLGTGTLTRLKVDYAVDDHWNLQAGVNEYAGPDLNYFGQLKKNNDAYLQLRVSW